MGVVASELNHDTVHATHTVGAYGSNNIFRVSRYLPWSFVMVGNIEDNLAQLKDYKGPIMDPLTWVLKQLLDRHVVSTLRLVDALALLLHMHMTTPHYNVIHHDTA